MSGEKTRAGMTRRDFMKGAMAVGALGVAAGGMATTANWLAPATAVAEPEEHVAYLYHRTHCGCHCSLKCSVRDGRLCMIEPNDAYQDECYRTVCAKGISEIQHVYSAERIQTPMKRVGQRGEAQFVSITWDEAYQILEEEVRKAGEQYGPESVLVHCSSECRGNYSFLPAILGASTQGAVGIDMGLGNGRDVAFGPSKGCTSLPGEYTQCGAGWNRPTNEPRDLVNAKYILAVGNNMFHSVLTRSSLVFDAQEAGAKLIAVDPNYSQMAQKSDEWIPIQPGTDAALYLGMCSHIVEERLYDEGFMKRRTDFCFLVDVASGERLSAGGDDEAIVGLVWDNASNSAVRHDEAQDPALTGRRTIDGVECRTVFDLFCESLKEFPIGTAAELTHIPQEKIEEIARDYATSGASTLMLGYGGNDKMANADIAGHAVAALTALTGNIGKPGASNGSYADGIHGYQATLGSWKLPDDVKAATLELKFFRLPYEESNVHMAIIAGDSPMNRTANYTMTEQWLDSLDFLVAIDMYYTSYTDHADLVLPACTVFESEEPYVGIEAYGGYVLLREKAIDPLFESKTDYAIQNDIAEIFGRRDLLPKTQEEFIRHCLDTSTDETIEGITLDTLVANQGLQPQSCQKTIRRAYVDKFGTKSGRLELYNEAMLPYDQQLPKWEPADEAGEDGELRSKFPLQFATYKSKFRVHNQFWDSSWNNQYESASIEMNGVDMESRGLEDGDEVRIFNDRGEFVTSVLHNEAVRPGFVRMPSGAWKKNVKSGCFQNVSNSNVYERHSKQQLGYLIFFNDVLVEVEKA